MSIIGRKPRSYAICSLLLFFNCRKRDYIITNQLKSQERNWLFSKKFPNFSQRSLHRPEVFFISQFFFEKNLHFSSKRCIITISFGFCMGEINMKTTLKLIISAILSSAIFCTSAGAAAFTDTEGHWAEVFIDEMTNSGYLSGYPDGTF